MKLKRKQQKKDKLREPLELDEKVLVLAERLRKTDTPKNIYKSQQQMFVFLVEKKIIIKKRLKVSDNPLIYYYWIAPEDDVEKIKKEGFIRQELFVIHDQSIKLIPYLLTLTNWNSTKKTDSLENLQIMQKMKKLICSVIIEKGLLHK